MEGRILVILADYWISVGTLIRSDRQIRLTILQGVSGTSLYGGGTRMSKVPGKSPKINIVKSVLKPTQVDWAGSLR